MPGWDKLRSLVGNEFTQVREEGHDFEKVITIAVMGGWDSDCNGATAGSIAGAMLGAQALPEKWIAPLHDTLNWQVIGYHPIAISECARRSVEIALAIANVK